MKKRIAIVLPLFLTAFLALAGCDKETQFTLNITIENGPDCTVTPTSGATYPDGTIVELTAFSAPGYALLQWGGPDGASVTAENTILMNADKNVTAVFAKLQYDLALEASPAAGGTVETAFFTQSRSVIGVEHGQTVQLTARPNAGYVFDHWEGALTGTGNPATLTLTEQPSQAVIACFTPIIQGHVLGLGSRSGIAGVAITAGSLSTVTDSDGYWQIKGVSFPVEAIAAAPASFSYLGMAFSPSSAAVGEVTGTDIDFVMSGYSFDMTWGTDGSSDGQFSYPGDIAADKAGNIYVADSANHRIQKFSSGGTYLTQWGSYGNGNGQFSTPKGIAVDASGNVFVVDNGNHRVQKFASDGTYLAQWGSAGSQDGQFQYPNGIVVASGNIYVVDCGNHRIQVFNPSGTYLAKWGGYGSGITQFKSPGAIAADAGGHIYVVDCNNYRVQKFRSDGSYLTQWGTNGTGNGQFINMGGITVDGVGFVYVTDRNLNRIQMFCSDGAYIAQWGSLGSGNTQFSRPSGVASDAAGNLYVVETYNHRVQKFAGI